MSKMKNVVILIVVLVMIFFIFGGVSVGANQGLIIDNPNPEVRDATTIEISGAAPENTTVFVNDTEA